MDAFYAIMWKIRAYDYWQYYNTGQQQIGCQRFLADLGRIWCAESKNHIGFAQSGQGFEVWSHFIFYVFVHMYTCVEHFRRGSWG